MIIRTQAWSRAGLIGNPSDGYFGKTISFSVRNYFAEAVLFESPRLCIVPSQEDISEFGSVAALVTDVRRHGYYGGVRLIKAAIRRFSDYCGEQGKVLEDRNFTISYRSNIPRLVGMAGSSAIVTAAMKALMRFYEVDIEKPLLANLILSVEKGELGIGAGLQDRVCQVYEGLVYMDFNEARMRQAGYGIYEPLDPALLPPLYIAFDPDRAEGSEVFHNRVRTLFEQGDPKVVDAMKEFAGLAESCRRLLLDGRGREIGPLMNRNFDLRCTIYNIDEKNKRMIRTARSAGASAKFTGSGGCIV